MWKYVLTGVVFKQVTSSSVAGDSMIVYNMTGDSMIGCKKNNCHSQARIG